MKRERDTTRRAWRCTDHHAIYCPLCGDCTCSLTPDRVANRDSSACPLHGVDTGHPYRKELVP